MIVVFGMCVVSVSSVAPPTDDPETPYNESDAPITFAIPAAINATGAIQRLDVRSTIAIFLGQRVGRDDEVIAPAIKSEHGIHSPNPQAKLLSTLRC